MFFEEGYIPLSEATGEVFKRLQSLQANGKIADLSKGLKPHLTVTIWDICEVAIKVGVTASNASFIEASKDIVAWVDPREMSNEHLHMGIGSVGSSDLPGEDGKPMSREEREFTYGGFLSLPVCIPANSFHSSLTFLEEQVAQPLRDDEVVNAAKTILTMVKNGEVVTRELARERMGAKFSRRKLKLAWALAADHHPDLTRPNRYAGL
ncbi:hypothetical protein AIOL_000991 [Candidatus Rhodobacter oscarellae]|uniref:Uncharacterized protein n=1 Tax=Candidatus Rhodobacter oscarellae TaxID=1675527 RepID=A0A0J9EDX1_9RHOB|nr:hypothetical protein [Candidatus Rhodobacter lobularis]KMW60826.1 hypothetical protein AIOL_000991 [Candidatus Rhodobacter lobularis]